MGMTKLMNSQQIQLYERIQAFSLDQPDAYLSFSKRLARDQGWSLDYTQRVIQEYKKFVFLAVIADHPVTPSDQVDQVWHLHLSHTRLYWEEFCPQVLQMPLHHDPTRGGQAENQKFDDWYSKTLGSYEQFFGQVPPADIWSTPDVRFGRDLDFVRVNTQQNWVLPKSQIQRRATASVAVVLALILGGCYVGSSASPIDPLAGVMLVVICLGTGFGLIHFFAGILDFLKHPKAPRIGPGEGSSSCGVSGCTGWGWGDSSGHHGGGDSGSCGDGGGGCGGGGCGGGGCGG
jgi:hypothetical protein